MSTCIKVNSSGSWANLLPMVHPMYLGDALAACEALALANRGDITFKVIKDGADFAIFHKFPRKGEPHGWYNPAAIQNPVQAGVDRTTSGAIGQP